VTSAAVEVPVVKVCPAAAVDSAVEAAAVAAAVVVPVVVAVVVAVAAAAEEVDMSKSEITINTQW